MLTNVEWFVYMVICYSLTTSKMFDNKPSVICCETSIKKQGEMINKRLKFIVLNLVIYLLFCKFGSELYVWENLCLTSTGQNLLGVSEYDLCQNHLFCTNLFFLVLMPYLTIFSFLIIVKHENLGYWRSWIYWVSSSWQIDGKWKKWGQCVIFLLIMLYFWYSLTI